MRYYVYISDAKVDMLYEQIPQGPRARIAAELKIDLKVVSVSIRDRGTDSTRLGRLQVVENYLKRTEQVGSFANPSAWFEDRLTLRSGVYRSAPGGLVYFSGERGGALLALIGSARHLTGEQAAQSELQVGFSNLPSLVTYIADELPEPLAQDGLTDEDWALREIVEFTSSLTGVSQSYAFLARRLLEREIDRGDGTPSPILLGTPLYVALDDFE